MFALQEPQIVDSDVRSSVVVDFFEVLDCLFVVRLSLIEIIIGLETVNTAEEVVREA